MEKFNMPFGEFVKQRREELGKSMRAFAAEVKISPAYLCDIENGFRKAPDRFLEQFANALCITDTTERNRFYDMAGVSQNGQHSDINHYIDDLPSARLALRTARDKNYTDADWAELIRIIEQKK